MDKPNPIYKYTKLNKNLKNSLVESYLWFSHSEYLNDPFDLAYPKGTYKTIALHAFEKALTSSREKIHLLENIVPKDINILGAIDGFMEYVKSPEYGILFEANQESIIKAFPFSVCCFTEDEDNILMWSHYADSHKGVCLIYDLSQDERYFKGLGPVMYRDEPPTIGKIENDIIFSLLTKGPKWSYEKEWRLIQIVTGKRPIQRECLMGIIFGCKVKDTKIKEIISTCNQCGYKDLEFYKMEMADQFKLVRKKI